MAAPRNTAVAALARALIECVEQLTAELERRANPPMVRDADGAVWPVDSDAAKILTRLQAWCVAAACPGATDDIDKGWHQAVEAVEGILGAGHAGGASLAAGDRRDPEVWCWRCERCGTPCPITTHADWTWGGSGWVHAHGNGAFADARCFGRWQPWVTPLPAAEERATAGDLVIEPFPFGSHNANPTASSRELLKRALSSLRPRLLSDSRFRWALVMDAVGCGSGYALGLCRALGLDPDEPVEAPEAPEWLVELIGAPVCEHDDDEAAEPDEGPSERDEGPVLKELREALADADDHRRKAWPLAVPASEVLRLREGIEAALRAAAGEVAGAPDTEPRP